MQPYYAKLLLFGEYSIIKGASALAFPLRNYTGAWQFSDAADNSDLKKWCATLVQQQADSALSFGLDTARWAADLEKGLYFQSDIPQGYGVGSSGALCAALYREYGTQPLPPASAVIAELRHIFQQLENFFHGSSSGIDPLICYLDTPLLLYGKTDAKRIAAPSFGALTVFLLDTQQPRQTAPLVALFLEKLKNADFEKKIEQRLVAYNDAAIAAFLDQKTEKLWQEVAQISAFQAQYFEEMIPIPFRETWREGLKNQDFLLKLCGAGGGGFLLGFTKNWAVAQQLLAAYPLVRVEG